MSGKFNCHTYIRILNTKISKSFLGPRSEVSLDFILYFGRHDIDDADAFEVWTLAASARVPAVPSEPS